MKRRRYLLVTGTAAAVALAGCTEDDDESDTNFSSDNWSDSNVSLDDEWKSEPEFETYAEVREDELVVEETDSETTVTVTGVVENPSETELGWLQVIVTVLDENGVEISEYDTSTFETLPAGEIWEFEVAIDEAPDDIDDYDIEVHDTPAEDLPDWSEAGEDVRVVRHDLVVDEEDATADLTATGLVQNTGDAWVESVDVVVVVLDETDEEIGRYSTTVYDLDPHQTAPFEVAIDESKEAVADYTVTIDTDEE
jgi:hypothetical protein